MKHPKLTARQIREFLPKIPFNTLLGIKLTRVHRDGVTIECTLRHELTNSAGVAHGGVAAAMADVAVGMAINRHFGGMRRITTVEMKINYFRPASEGRIFARARLLRIGSTLSVGSVDLTDTKGNLIGTAIATYMFLDARGKGTPA
ncbi:MAG TPA: PaaI family thioesterase [Terriglobales bacterium]|nr:PaaI family thioesterase [Terriglobales bacterium]